MPQLRCLPGSDRGTGEVVVTTWENGRAVSHSEAVRPLPVRDDWFENVWHDYRERTHRLH